MYESQLKPPCAVIILNWNGAKLLRQYLPSVVSNTNPKYGRVIVADNGSTDESLQVLADEFADVEVMKFSENYGFAGGYNHAIREIEGKYKYVVLLNSDVETPSGWLEPLVDFLETHKDVGAVQPKLLSYNQKNMFEYAGASGGFLDCNGYPYCRGRIFATCEEDRGQYDDAISIFWATGAALTVRTDLYLSVGGLDEDFFAHMEEIDLCWRILLTGADIMVVPQSSVYHLGGGSLPASNPRKTYLNFRNNLLLLHKNLPDSTRAKKLFRRRLLDTIAWAKFALTFDFGNAGAVWRAHRHFATMRKKYTQHPTIDLLDTRSDTHRNILLDYYLRGRRTF
jgi:hypothetical protein